jgi:hypothetical protein
MCVPMQLTRFNTDWDKWRCYQASFRGRRRESIDSSRDQLGTAIPKMGFGLRNFVECICKTR